MAKLGWRGSLEERFWRFVEPEPMSGCYLWMGAWGRDGYPLIASGIPRVGPWRATRVAFELAGDPLGPDEQALHTCDVPSCVRRAHLFRGDDRANRLDAASKGRASAPRRPWPAEVVAAALHDHRSSRDVGRDLGVSGETVARWRREAASGKDGQ